MPSHLIFISLFLGIVSGKQMVELHADPAIKSIRILLGNDEILRLTEPPWRHEIDLGPELVPRELTAIGYDDSGQETARATQVLNLPRPTADVQIARSGDGVQLRWTNLQYTAPRKATLKFDGAVLKLNSEYRAKLPSADWSRPHLVEAEMRFDEGVIARREAVLEGTQFSEIAEAELTPILLRETSRSHPASYDGCLTLNGEPVRIAALEKPQARVIFVRDPDARETIEALDPALQAFNSHTRRRLAQWTELDADTVEQVFWPVAEHFRGGIESSLIFRPTREMAPADGLVQLLVREGPYDRVQPRRYADAVAVAGSNAISDGRRRAVVLILNQQYPDRSRDADPAAVRRYLQAIGVPFFVWSLTGLQRWGAAEDISTLDHLRDATAKLREALSKQRIAWIATPPLDALHVSVDERCGFAR